MSLKFAASSRLLSRGVCVEPLESRQLCTITPAHLALMERSVAETTPANNLYYNGTPAVTWNGINSQTITSVKADCTTYVTVLLKQAYGFTNSDFTTLFGVSSPSLTRYYDQAKADGALDGFMQISDVKPGDLFISKYADQSTTLGHMTVIESAPTLVSVGTTYKAYNVTILDVTGSPHTNDTRTATADTGVGRGDIRLYTDLAGNLDHWAWGTKTTSTTYTAADRPATFAHVPALNPKSPSLLKAVANGETTVNLSWSDNSGIEDGYVIQRSSDAGTTWATIGDVPTNVSTYVDTTVTPGSYKYRVYAMAGASASGYSAAASVTVSAVTPAMPTNLSATLSGANVQVTWQDNASNEVKYVLERSTDDGAYTVLTGTAANAVGYLDTSASTGHFYHYRLHAESLYAASGTTGMVSVNRILISGPRLPVAPSDYGTPVAVIDLVNNEVL